MVTGEAMSNTDQPVSSEFSELNHGNNVAVIDQLGWKSFNNDNFKAVECNQSEATTLAVSVMDPSPQKVLKDPMRSHRQLPHCLYSCRRVG